MTERHISEELILEIVETGTVRAGEKGHLWIYKALADRDDNLLCLASVIDNGLVIKTVMHHWEPMP